MKTISDQWLQQHPFLEPLSQVESAIASVLATLAVPQAPAVKFEALEAEYRKGTPLLRHEGFAQEVAAQGAALLAPLAAGLAKSGVAPKLAATCATLAEKYAKDAAAARADVAWTLEGAPQERAPEYAGSVRYLAWAALRKYLSPVIGRYGEWRNEQLWSRPLCPTCGARPTMAVLVGVGAGKQRLLACGCCQTRWQYKRIGCPHCGNDTQNTLEILDVDGEAGLRIDGCQACSGYVKTYAGEAEPSLYLKDWPTLHVDLMAQERGFARHGASLYEL